MKRLVRTLGVLSLVSLAFVVPTVAQPQRDGATIVNSGSTNANGFMLKVWSDGRAGETPVAHPSGAGLGRELSVPIQAAQRFLNDAKAAKNAAIAVEPCMKSASFGVRLNVMYHGWTSPDLSCPGGGSLADALRTDVQTITQATGAAATPIHRIRLPNEPRRVPVEGPPSPAPSESP